MGITVLNSYFTIIFTIIMVSSIGIANAELSYDDQLEFANSIEEISGHILAAKKNIVDGNSEQASIHLAHPIDLLYDNLHSELKIHSNVDKKLEFSLSVLKNTETDVNIDFFDKQANEIFKVLDETKLALIPADTVSDSTFKLNTIANLLEISKMNYELGIQSNDELTKSILIDDSCAFVMRAENILYSINDMDLAQKQNLELQLQQTLSSISNNQPLVDIKSQFDSVVDQIVITQQSGLGFVQTDMITNIGFMEIQPSSTSSDSILFETSSIPSWIKLGAAWWSDDLITDVEFLSGIEYLLEQKILVVSVVQAPLDSTSNELPSWIKNRAGWWADDILSDAEFLSGIEYMIEKGIIVV